MMLSLIEPPVPHWPLSFLAICFRSWVPSWKPATDVTVFPLLPLDSLLIRMMPSDCMLGLFAFLLLQEHFFAGFLQPGHTRPDSVEYTKWELSVIDSAPQLAAAFKRHDLPRSQHQIFPPMPLIRGWQNESHYADEYRYTREQIDSPNGENPRLFQIQILDNPADIYTFEKALLNRGCHCWLSADWTKPWSPAIQVWHWAWIPFGENHCQNAAPARRPFPPMPFPCVLIPVLIGGCAGDPPSSQFSNGESFPDPSHWPFHRLFAIAKAVQGISLSFGNIRIDQFRL